MGKVMEAVNRIKQDLSALFLAYKRKDTPLLAKIAAVAAVGYALSPIDLIPDFVPLLGYLDDIIILPLLISLAVKLIPKHILAECREQAVGLWKDGKPKSWKYAIPLIIIWVVVIAIIAKWAWGWLK
ncbi:MAG: DUF1232 domain-containing protein [Clostridiales bacterium]|nr:DUF1232 domain-containing protein [Clostridiales bacterium]